MARPVDPGHRNAAISPFFPQENILQKFDRSHGRPHSIDGRGRLASGRANGVESRRKSKVSRLGRYEIVGTVGRGGMATVYVGHPVDDPGHSVALKLMHPHLERDPDWADHLKREGALLATVHSEHIVKLFEVCDDDDGVYLVLEYVKGASVADLLNAAHRQQEQLPLRVAGRILLDTLAGLSVVHTQRANTGQRLNIIHRDVSPHNILVGTDGVARLTDFGIAKATGDKTTATGVLKGKLRYMSPEQVLGKRPDHRTDIWSTGVSAWEMLTGTRMHDDCHEAALLMRIASRPPPSPRDVSPDISAELSDVIMGALRVDLDERFSSADAFATELARALKNTAGIASRAEVAECVGRVLAVSHRRLVTTAPAERTETVETGMLEPDRSSTYALAGGDEPAPTDSPDAVISSDQTAPFSLVSESDRDTIPIDEPSAHQVNSSEQTAPFALVNESETVPSDQPGRTQSPSDPVRIPTRSRGPLVLALVLLFIAITLTLVIGRTSSWG